MANANKIPELCNAMRVYQEGNSDLLGIADVTLPNIQSMTQTVSGMGMSGEVEAPVQGQYQSMKLGLNWNTQKPESIAMSGGKGVALECRGALQNWDSGNNQYVFHLKSLQLLFCDTSGVEQFLQQGHFHL